MGLAKGTQPLPFGHSADAAVDIDGLAVSDHCSAQWMLLLTYRLQLLEDHLEQLRAGDAKDAAEDDEAAWNGWDVESDSSEESGSEGWMDVDSGGEDNLDISDSEDEAEKASGSKPSEAAPEAAPDPNRISTLATTKVTLLLTFLANMADIFA